MKLQKKISIMVMIIIISVLFLVTTFSLNQINKKILEKTKTGLIDMAITISYSPIIQENVGQPFGEKIINSYVNKIRIETGVKFITVTDNNRIRYSHPNEEQVGKPFSNNNIDRAILNGDTYTDEGLGSMGVTIKAFAPIFKDRTQVGVVCVGVLKDSILDEYLEFSKGIIPIIVFVAIFGFFATKIVAKSIKKTIYGLEPVDIALLLNEKDIILNNIADGIIAVDKHGKISLINDKAKEILGIDKDLTNYTIEVLDIKIAKSFKKILNDGIPITNIEQKLDRYTSIISNYLVVKDNDTTLGTIVTFKNKTEVEVLIDELAGIKKINWDLRAQNHEFMNKLHTILGLIQLCEYEEANKYIIDISKNRNEITLALENIKEVSISALLLAKYNRASEAKVTMIIDKESTLNEIPLGMSIIQLGCIIGNIIENSIEAVIGVPNGEVYISITQEEKLEIIIENNGHKIEEKYLDKIFKSGFSTKGDNRGLGLSNVLEIIDGVNGIINIESSETETIWYICI